jgi:uncharacterized protein (TIRG00374 family)
MSRRAGLLVAGTIVAALLVGLLLAASDLRSLRAHLAGASPGYVALAALCAVLSYACIAGTQLALLRALGAHPPAAFLLRASLVATTVSRFLRSGGASGVAFLAWALARRGVPARATVTAGIGIVLLNDLVFAGLLLVGLAFLATQPQPAPTGLVIAYVLGALGLGAMFLVAWTALRRPRTRERFGEALAALAGRIGRRFRRPGWREVVRASLSSVGDATHELLGRPRATAWAWPWAIARVTFSLLALAACARAVDARVGASALVIVFTAAKLVGTISIVPGGIGIADGSVAGLLTLFGASYEAALAAALLHRLAYHVVPAIVAALLAGPLLGEALRPRPPAAA